MKKLFLSHLLIAVVVIMVITPLPAGAQAEWHDAQTIDNDDGHSGEVPCLAIDGLNAVALWSRLDGSTNCVYGNHSSDGGATWGEAGQVQSATGGDGIHPQAVISGLNVVAVWQQSVGLNQYRIYANRSTDGGDTWLGEQAIDEPGYDSSRPQIAMAGSNVVVTWGQEDGSGERVAVNYSTDGGANWQGAQLISDAGHSSYLPQLVMSGPNAVAVWNQDSGDDEQFFSSYSPDGGANWSSPVAISATGGGNYAGARLAMSGPCVVAAWHQSDGAEIRIFSNYSTDNGVTWHEAQILDNGEEDSYLPDIAISGYSVIAVWSQDSGIWSSYSKNRGKTWYSPRRIKGSLEDSLYPRIAMTGEGAAVIWYQWHSSGDGIASSYSLSEGVNWSTGQVIGPLNSHHSHFPINLEPGIAASGPCFAAIWNQYDQYVSRIYSNYALFSRPTGVPGTGFTGCIILALLFGGLIVRLLYKNRPRKLNL